MNRIIKYKRVGYKTILSVLFPILMFIDGYMVPGTNYTPINTLFFILIMLFLLAGQKKISTKDKVDKLLLILAGYLLVDQFFVLMRFSYIPIASNTRQLVINISFILLIVLLPKHIDYQIFYRTYLLLVIVSCIGLIYQSIQVYILHRTTRMLVLPGMHSLLSPATKNYIEALYNRMRPSSFFTEPSAFANFTIPMIIMALNNKSYKMAVFVTVCNLLTTSTTGIFISFAIWVYWICFKIDNKLVSVFAAILFAGFCVFIIQSSFFVFALSKIKTTDFTTNERIASALAVFSQMPILDKLTGIGLENVALYIKNAGINMSGVMVTSEGYVTSAFGNFVKTGLIGGILYFILCVRMIFTKNKSAALLGIIIFVISFIQTISFNSGGVWWFVIYKLLNQQDDRTAFNKYYTGNILNEGFSY